MAALLAALTSAYAQDEKADSQTDESAEPEVAVGRSDEPDAPSDDEPIARPELCPWYNKNTGEVYDPNFGDGEWGIPPATPFSDLPDDWKDAAGGPKADYEIACDRGA